MYIFNELLLSVPYSLLIIPIVTYSNANIYKKNIMTENKGKSGIYRTNLLNGKSYVGSAVDLSKRLSKYYSKKQMYTILTRSKSAIYSSIGKYRVSMFKLDILEYCEP